MEKYKNLDGDSSVVAYEIGIDSLIGQFSDGAIDIYTYQSAGQSNIARMKTLAMTGEGLNSFIMRYVRKPYAARLR